MPSNQIPIEGYPSEFIEFYKAAALEPKRVWFVSKTEADGLIVPARSTCYVIRARLHNLRAAMRKAQHPLYEQIAKITISIEGRDGHNCHGSRGQTCPDPEGDHCLYGRIRDTDVLSAFHDAGITREQLSADPLADLNLGET